MFSGYICKFIREWSQWTEMRGMSGRYVLHCLFKEISTDEHIYLSSSCKVVDLKSLLYKHQWNTRWAFARKHDIFTREIHMWKYHRCYGYIINRAFHTKKLLKWNGLVFHWCLYNKENITWPLGDTKFLFSCSLRSLMKYFSKLTFGLLLKFLGRLNHLFS